ncbi:MAG: vanadium-dependent haloperoxidase [Saprospiraceae bacterium]|nr:vanadium-dependent haloperoxidase [Saprospiraceae bacterium]
MRTPNISLFPGLVMAILVVFYWLGCYHAPTAEVEENQAMHLVVDWNKYILKAEVGVEGFRGPIMARMYGYVGLAAYEAGLPGFSGDFRSMASYFPTLILPKAPSRDSFNMAISLNACYATIIGNFFITSPDQDKLKRRELTKTWDTKIEQDVDTSIVRISKKYGREIANAVFEWSSTDSLGHNANHHNYDRNYISPTGEGKWVTSSDFPMPPLLPYWGKVRPFIINTESYLARPIPTDTAETHQLFHRQALELISLNSPLTPENQWIGDFWNDDHPGMMFTAPGHWLSIVNQVITREHPPIEKVLETYMKTGFALSDALVACWYSKYLYNLERPETYIQREIDKAWRPYSLSPSFPSYPSGHAMMGAATAAVLTELFGSAYKMMDCSHEGFENIKVKPREFNTFQEMAKEDAMSRLFIGVHWRMDCEEGMRLGNLIGNNISHLELENKLTE